MPTPATLPEPPAGNTRDRAELSRFGYAQELARTLGLLAGIGIAFCEISPVVGVYTLFGYGLATGGPFFIWGVPIVLGGQLLVALVFSELAVEYPLAGSLYQWARRLIGPRYGWFVGWLYGVSLIVTLAAVDLGAAPFVAALMGWPLTRDLLAIIGATIVIGHTIFNHRGLRGTMIVTWLGVAIELTATVLLGVALLATGPLQPWSTLVSRETASGPAGAGAFMAAILAIAWIFYGFESAADVAEEIVDAPRKVPRAMVLSLVGGAAVTVFLLIVLILATPDLAAAAANPAATIPIVLEARLGWALSRVVLVLVVLAYFSCGGAVQTAAARLVYSYARDGMVPGSSWLRRVTPDRRVPANAITFVAIGALVVIAFTSVELGAVDVTALVASFAVVGMYLSYQSVVLARLMAPAMGWVTSGTHDHFSLGRWGTVVALAALLYGSTMTVNLCWPRPSGSAGGWLTLATAAGIVLPGAVIARWRRLPTERT